MELLEGTAAILILKRKDNFQSLELHKQLLGEEHPHVATSLNNLALLYYDQGRFEDAEHLFLQSLAISKTALGKNH